jgi:hypothetical protein
MKNDLFLKYLNGKSEFIPLELIPSTKLTIKESLDIYRNGYFSRLTDVLGEHFEACWKILGDQLFLSICNDYILKHPSSEWNINRYGKLFPSVLASNPVSENYPFLNNLAEFEWNKQNLFHEKDDLGLPATASTSMNENSKLEFVSSIHIGASPYNIPEIFNSAKNNKEFLLKAIP